MQDARADARMLLDEPELFRRQRSRLPQHIVADADLADVMQKRAEAQDVELVVGQAHLPADGDGDGADSFGVARGVRVARVERQCQRSDGADVGVPRLCLGFAHRLHHRVEGRVSVSTSSEKPVSATGWSKSRDDVISDSERDSVSIGLEIVRASQTLAKVARPKAPSAMSSTDVKAFCIGTRVAASMESSA